MVEVPLAGQSQKVLGMHKAFMGSGVVSMGTGCQARAGLRSKGLVTNSGLKSVVVAGLESIGLRTN